MPGVAVGIEQVEPLLDLLEADATGGLVVAALGMVAVGADEADGAGNSVEMDVDEAGVHGADAVFEGVLHEADQDVGGNHGVGAGTDVEMVIDADIFAQSHTHQCDIVVEEFCLLRDRHHLVV